MSEEKTRVPNSPARYSAVSPRGNVSALEFKTAGEAAAYAKECWPGFEQDETRSGKGWDIEVVTDDPATSRASHYS